MLYDPRDRCPDLELDVLWLYMPQDQLFQKLLQVKFILTYH